MARAVIEDGSKEPESVPLFLSPVKRVWEKKFLKIEDINRITTFKHVY